MQELHLAAQHVVVVLAAFVGVIVTAAAAVELALWGAFGNAQRRPGWSDRVGLGDDQQDGAADVGCFSHGSVSGDTEERASGDAVVPLRSVPGANDVQAGECSLVRNG